MIEIRLLGAQSVRASDGTEILSVSAQPKRLSLLAYLAIVGAEGDGFVDRESLLRSFWPDADEQRARNTLNQHLYRLRASLGHEAIPGDDADRVGIDPTEVSCDVVQFRRALADRDVVRALELYSGDFLPGFHVSGMPDLEKWLDNHRRELRRQAVGAALEVARGAEEAGEPAAAAKAYRRALDLDPREEKAIRGLAAATAAVAAAPVVAAPVDEPDGGRRPAILVPLLLLGAIAIGGWWARSARERLTDPAPRLSVLAFADHTGDATLETLLTEAQRALHRRIRRGGGILVVAPSAAAPPVGVDLLAEIDVRTRGDSVDLFLRLLDVATDRSVRTGSYTAARTDTARLVLQFPWLLANEIRQSVIPGTELELAPPRTPAPGTLAAYLAGLEHLSDASDDGVDSALADLGRAVASDPGFTDAWVALGRAWQSAGDRRLRSTVEAMPEARSAFDRALALDPARAEAYAGIAAIEWRYDWDAVRAERAFRRALELDPAEPDARALYGMFLRSVGRLEEGLVELDTAVALDPDGVHWAGLWQLRHDLGHDDAARDAAERMAALHPDHPATRRIRAIDRWERGDRVAAADSMATEDASGSAALAAMMYALAGAGDRARDELARAADARDRDCLQLARGHLLLGDTTAALEWLDRGVVERNPGMVWLEYARRAPSDGYAPVLSGLPAFDIPAPEFDGIRDRVGFPVIPAAD